MLKDVCSDSNPAELKTIKLHEALQKMLPEYLPDFVKHPVLKKRFPDLRRDFEDLIKRMGSAENPKVFSQILTILTSLF